MDTTAPAAAGPTETGPAEATTRSADGTRIGWRRSGIGDPTVLLHGTSADSASWALAGPYLGRRLTLLAVDRRGRGRSDVGEPYSFEREVEDLAAVIAALGEAPHVVGHSFGAVVAVAAAAVGVPIRSLTLYEPPLAVAAHVDVRRVADDCERAVSEGDRERVLRIFYRAVGDESAVDLLKASPPVFSRLLENAHTIPREVRATERFLEIDASHVTVPTRLILGTASPAYFSEGADALHTAIPGSEVVLFPGQAHLGHALAPDVFARLVLEFTGSID